MPAPTKKKILFDSPKDWEIFLDIRDSTENSPSPVRRTWHRLSEESIREAHLNHLLLRFRPFESLRLLEIGGGDGRLAFEIATVFPRSEVICLEPNPHLFERANKERRLPNLTFHQEGFEKCTKWGAFDAIICSEVFEHVEDTSQLIRSIYDCLLPDGVLTLSTPSGWMYRRPSLRNFYLLFKRGPISYWKLYLHPEKNWKEALAIHPAIFPPVLIKWMQKKFQFKLILRSACSPDLGQTERTSLIFQFYKMLERFSPLSSAHLFQKTYQFLASSIQLIPLFRLWETRAAYLFCKPNDKNEKAPSI